MKQPTRRSDRERLDLEQDRLLTVDAVCAWLGLSRPKVYELMGSGQLVSYKLGRSRRIAKASVLAYLARCRQDS